MKPFRYSIDSVCKPYGNNKNKNKIENEKKKKKEKKNENQMKNADLEPERLWVFPAISNGTVLRMGGAL